VIAGHLLLVSSVIPHTRLLFLHLTPCINDMEAAVRPV
jgi:hypothetical protein